MTVSAEPATTAEDRPPPRPRPALDALLRAGGLTVTLLATVVTAIAELYLTPLRVGGVPIGVAVPFAAVANWGLAWFAVRTTGRRWASGPPWALWTLLMIFASGVRTPEGDHLLSGNDWVALVMILVGSLVFAVHAYRMILHRPTV